VSVLRQPGGLSDEHLVDHLPDLLGCANRSDQRIVEHGKLEEFDIASDRGFDRHTLNVD
jgi:hypothetical protein